MREMYQRESEMPTTHQHHELMAAAGNDPFYDRFPWFRLIGRFVCFMTLTVSLRDVVVAWRLWHQICDQEVTGLSPCRFVVK